MSKTAVMKLPTIPAPEALVALADIEALESSITKQLVTVDDLDVLQLWRAQAAALATYLHGKQLHLPMLAVQRKIEARIGQVLGEPRNGGDKRRPHFPHVGSEISKNDRLRFRILARGLAGGLPDEEWRLGRDALLKLIHARFPVTPKTRNVPTVVKSDGRTYKPEAMRAEEIKRHAAEGMRAAQIGEAIGMSAERVRHLAKRADIVLADKAIGRPRRLDAMRILTETINGVDAYVSGLTMLDGVPLPEMPARDATELMQSIMRSINGLKKLRTRMEDSYARPISTATPIR